MREILSILNSDMALNPRRRRKFLHRVLYFVKTKRGHYAAMGPTSDGRFLVLVFEMKGKGIARVITGWDMSDSERRYYTKSKSG
jgi:uncharacterized DUF497 family protein